MRFGEAGEIELIASRLDQVAPAQYILTLYWRAHRQPKADYHVFVHLVDAQGALLATFDSPPMGGLYPFSTWLPGQIVVDQHVVEVPTNIRPTALRVGLYELETLKRLPAHDASGVPLESEAVVLPLPSR